MRKMKLLHSQRVTNAAESAREVQKDYAGQVCRPMLIDLKGGTQGNEKSGISEKTLESNKEHYRDVLKGERKNSS